MKTLFPNQLKPEARAWFIADATGMVLGRLATQIAGALRGRRLADWAPHVDNGAYVVVTNCDKIEVTGGKEEKKTYVTHSKYVGSLREIPYKEMFAKDPRKVLELAVEGMLPRTKLRPAQMRRLKLVIGSQHEYADRNPVAL